MNAIAVRPVTEFKLSAVSLEPLKCLAGPQDTPYSSKLKLRTSKSSETEASDSVLTSLMPRLEVEEVDEKWIESLEALTGVLQQRHLIVNSSATRSSPLYCWLSK